MNVGAEPAASIPSEPSSPLVTGQRQPQDGTATDDPVTMAYPAVCRAAGRYPDARFYDDMARQATGGSLDAVALLEVARSGLTPREVHFDARGVAWFGHVTASRLETGTAARDAVALLELSRRVRDGQYRSPGLNPVWIQARRLAHLDVAADQPLKPEQVPADVWWAAEADRIHPRHFHRGAAATAAWLEVFNRPFRERGLESWHVSDGPGTPFDRLHCSPAGSGTPVDGPLVSVVMPIFNPGPSLVGAVEALTTQSWPNLEILLCDDHSTQGREILSALATSDDRVRILRASANAGAYAARNMGLGLARGQFVTFNDADDISHPRRVERQVMTLLEAGKGHACTSRSIRVTEDLHLTVMGRPPGRVNLSSVMFDRVDVMRELGGFDAVRRGGDSEFISRFVTRFGDGSLIENDDPLALVQLTEGSLSRDDFRFLRTHPARHRYQSAFRHWHRRIADHPEEAFVAPGARAPFPAPSAMTGSRKVSAETVHDVDVVFLANGTEGAPTVPDLGSEAGALVRADLSVGYVEYLAPYDLTESVRPVRGDLAELIHRGDVQAFLPGDRVHARLVVVRDPAAVGAMPMSVLDDLTSDAVLVIADYRLRREVDPAQVSDELASRLLGVGGAGPSVIRWLPATETIATDLRRRAPAITVGDPALFGCAPPIAHDPVAPRPLRVGINAVTMHHTDEAALAEQIDALTPRNGGLVWGASRASALATPNRAAHLGAGEHSVHDFLRRVDVVVVDAVPERGGHSDRVAVAALQHRRVLIVDDSYHEHFGDAALSLAERSVQQWVDHLAGDPDALTHQLQAGARFIHDQLGLDSIQHHVISSLTSTRKKAPT